MSLSAWTTTINSARQSDNFDKGMRVAHVEFTVGATGDYSSGFDIASNKGKFGFRVVFDVLAATVRTSGGTQRLMHKLWNPVTGKLRFTNGATVEITAGSDLAAGDIVNMVVVGV